MRYMKFKSLGGSDIDKIDSIAKSEGVSKDTIRKSVQQIEAYHEQNKSINVDYRINESILNVMPAFEKSMTGLLNATELVEVNDALTGTKKVIEQHDKTTRLEASRIVKDIIVSKQPKVPLAEINVNQTNQVANLSSCETNEERMDRLRKKAAEANLLPAEIAAVPSYIDRDEPLEDDDEEEPEEDDREDQ
jgi:hypothetical protein